MRSTLKFLIALAVALLLMLAFRSLAFTIYAIDGPGLKPTFMPGDHVMVNRWSYGLRTGGGRLFNYGRLLRQPVRRGDIVALEDPADSTFSHIIICRCSALPGDTVLVGNQPMQVPGLETCADADYYWMRSLNAYNQHDSRSFGFVPEERILGRVVLIVYNKDASLPFWQGWQRNRWFLLP